MQHHRSVNTHAQAQSVSAGNETIHHTDGYFIKAGEILSVIRLLKLPPYRNIPAVVQRDLYAEQNQLDQLKMRQTLTYIPFLSTLAVDQLAVNKQEALKCYTNWG